MKQHIEEAIERFRLLNGRYIKTERYYAGNHDLAFATEKFRNTFGTLFREFALNLCPAICDAVRDKLRVTGFSVDHIGKPNRPDTDVGREARRIWHTNRMRSRAAGVHTEALKNGDAYAIIWPNSRGRATIYPNRAATCTVIYDDEQPGKIVRAAKYWRMSDKRIRLNLFYADRIEKYISINTSDGLLPDASGFQPFGGGDTGTSSGIPGYFPASTRPVLAASLVPASDSVIPNPYGVVPVFHFANNADLGLPGRSEIEPAIPIQDGLNKSMLDMLVAMEFSAFRQRWAAGIEIDYDQDGKPITPFRAGVDHVWMSQNADTKFGDFETANLEQFLKVKDSFRIDMALVTGTPLHYFTPNLQGSHSFESLKKSETRFLAKVRNRHESFGQVWSDVMEFALAIEGFGNDVRCSPNGRIRHRCRTESFSKTSCSKNKSACPSNKH